MTWSESSWKRRYYELEFTLEQILMGFEKVLANAEATGSGPGVNETSGIRKVTRIEFDGAEVLCCVADGVNMEYSFDFFKGRQQILGTPFQRVNVVPLVPALNAGADRCTVLVRTHDGDNQATYSKDVTL